MTALRCLAVTLVLTLASPSALAMFAQPTLAPVDRIITNAERYAEKHAEDAQAWYIVGRAHYLAWAMKGLGVPTYRAGDEDAAPQLPPDWNTPGLLRLARQAEAERRALEAMGVETRGEIDREEMQRYWEHYRRAQQALDKADWKPEPAKPEVLDAHATDAIQYFRKAIELGDMGGLYHIGLASILEEYAPRAEARRLNIATLEQIRDRMLRPEGFITRQWREAAMEQYFKAYSAGKAAAKKLRNVPVAGLRSLIVVQAAAGYERVAEADEQLEADPERVEEMEAFLAKLSELPPGPITPIVFALEEVERIGSLIDTEASVAFDLDGTGRASQRWQWVEPGAVLLVWDPHETGRIASGRQLFGSATWWLLPGDGFRAMALLDDDGDGWLAGEELRGLAGWRDRNGDGLSQRGEVVPLETLGVRGLATEATGHDGDHPVHRSGLRLEGGRTLPLWDWLAEPADRPQE